MIRSDSDWNASQLAQAAIEKGLLLVAAGPTVLRIVPPLVISRREVRLLLERLEATLSSQS